MIIFPTPFLGRNSIYRGRINYMAFGATFPDGATFKVKHNFRVSADGERWHGYPLKGDIVNYTAVAPDGLGAFVPVALMRFGSKILLTGKIHTSGSTAIAALFVSDVSDPMNFARRTTPADGFVSDARILQFGRAGSNGTTVAVVNSKGDVAYSTDALNWSAGAALPSAGLILSLAASPPAFVVLGLNGSAFGVPYTSGSPAASWSQGSLPINVALPSDSLAVDSATFIFGAIGAIFTAPASGPSSWTQQSLPAPTGGSAFKRPVKAEKWMAANADNIWLESANGLGGWVISADKPALSGGPFDMIHANGKTIAIGQSGIVGVRTDGGNWNTIANSGLDPSSNAPCIVYCA